MERGSGRSDRKYPIHIFMNLSRKIAVTHVTNTYVYISTSCNLFFLEINSITTEKRSEKTEIK